MLKVRNCGASRCVVRSSLARQGIILARLGGVWSCQVKQAFISALRGLAWYCTVLSCPVRLCEALFSKLSLWYGGAVSGPVGSCGVWLCKVWHFLVRSGCVGWSTLERCFVWLGKVSSWSCEVLFAIVGRSGVLRGLALSCRGVVRFGCAGFCGVLCAAAIFRRGIARLREALFRVVMFGPVKHCYVRHAKVSLRIGKVKRCLVSCCRAGQAFASLRWGQVWFGTILQCNAWCSLVSLRSGVATQGSVKCSRVKQASAFFGGVRVGMVRRCPVRFSSVKCCIAGHGLELLRLGWKWQSPVMQGILRYGGYQK